MLGELFVTHKVVQRHLKVFNHKELIDLDVLGTAAYDIILGLPWLREHNPWIDWKNQRITLKCHGLGTPRQRPAQLTTQLVDEKEINNISSNKTRQVRAVDRADTNQPQDHKATVKEDSTTPDIPDEYREFIDLFRDKKTAKALPQHQE